MFTAPRPSILEHRCPRHLEDSTSLMFYNTVIPSLIWIFSCGDQVSLEPDRVKLTLMTMRSERTSMYKQLVDFQSYIDAFAARLPHKHLPLSKSTYLVWSPNKILATDITNDAVDFMLSKVEYKPTDISVGDVEKLLLTYTIEQVLPQL